MAESIRYVLGDATLPEGPGNKIIAHVCNDISKWGKGFVLALSKRSLEPEKAFRAWFAERQNNDYKLGAVQFVQISCNVWIANMIGQHGIRATGKMHTPPVRYEAIEEALSKVSEKALELQASVHMPRIGCGLAGGRWEDIEPIITR